MKVGEMVVAQEDVWAENLYFIMHCPDWVRGDPPPYNSHYSVSWEKNVIGAKH
jgi:hypothetical protein